MKSVCCSGKPVLLVRSTSGVQDQGMNWGWGAALQTLRTVGLRIKKEQQVSLLQNTGA